MYSNRTIINFYECKYYNKHLDTITKYIQCLYEINNYYNASICKFVLDDNNFRDDDIKCLINECNKPENSFREEIGIAKLIANELSKLTIQERALLFSSLEEDLVYIDCDKNCEDCSINNGKMQER